MNRKAYIAIAVSTIIALAGIYAYAQISLPSGVNIDVNKAIRAGKQLKKAATPWTYREERTNGRILAAKVVYNFRLWDDPGWMNYINTLGRSLAPYSKRPDIKYFFGILDTEDVNAYSCPGGYVFITRGTLKAVETEGELAVILAHEIGHIADKDIEKEVRKAAGLDAAFNVGLMVADNTSQISGEQVYMMEQMGNASWDVLISKGLSKEDEFQADQLATEDVVKLGYSPLSMKSFLQKLLPMESGANAQMKILLSTHPKPSRRIEELDKFIAQKGWTGSNLPDHKERFQSFRQAHPIH